jgi:hypothetical protein
MAAHGLLSEIFCQTTKLRRTRLKKRVSFYIYIQNSISGSKSHMRTQRHAKYLNRTGVK